jgi:hypothetical protein
MSTFYSKGRTAGAAAIAAPEEAGNKLVEAEVLFEYLETLCEICWNCHLATYSRQIFQRYSAANDLLLFFVSVLEVLIGNNLFLLRVFYI